MQLSDAKRFTRLIGISWWFEIKILGQYPLTLFGTLLHYLWGLAFRVLFWSIVVRYSSLSFTPLSQIVSYFFIAEFLYAFFLCDAQMASTANRYIKSGKLSYLLSRPGSPLVQLYSKAVSGYTIGQIASLVFLFIGIIVSGGLLKSHSLATILVLVLSLINALVLNLSYNIAFATLTFYTTEAKSLRNVLLHILRILRGEWVPLFLLSASVVNVLQVLPTASTYYIPVRLLQGEDIPVKLVLLGSLWSVPIFYLSVRYWRRGLKQYEAVGI